MSANPEDKISFWHYFRSPFPRAEGFSAYRMPGIVVHLPIIFFFIWLGAGLAFGDPWLYPLFLVYLVIGVYFGRDVAILAHYIGLITIGVVGGAIVFINYAPSPPQLGLLASASVTAAIGVVFALYVSWYIDLGLDDAPRAKSGRFNAINRFIDRVDNAATLSGDSEPLRLRKTLLIFLCAAGIMVAPWAGRHLFLLGLPVAAGAALGFALISLGALIFLVVTKREMVAACFVLFALLAAPFIIQWEMGGFAASGAIILWALLAPLCALVFFGTRWAVLWFGGFALLVLAIAARDIAGGANLQTVLFFCENILIVSCVAFIALRFFIIERDRVAAALSREQERSERLLLNILPAEIAERLKGEHRTMADGYAEVSILFGDIVGFTKMSATISPEQLVELLNKLFSRFDMLCDEYGVEKIKTIGDAYMVCAGLPIPRPDHAEAIADMALGMQVALAEHNREFGSNLKIRIGINTGPVVAGVIGLKKFIYDLWGDTVNLASRMESHGVPDGIQVSAATREKLIEQFEFTSRGLIEIKGMGAIEAWLLVSRKNGAAKASIA